MDTLDGLDVEAHASLRALLAADRAAFKQRLALLGYTTIGQRLKAEQALRSLNPDVRPRPAHPPPPLTSWDDVVSILGRPSELQSLWRGRRGFAASLAFGIHQLPRAHVPPATAERWTVWIVGARESTEGLLAHEGLLVEVLARLCPEAPGWELELIGPEMGSWEEVRPHPAGLPLIVRGHRGTLHTLASSALTPPHLVTLFNSGIGTLCLPLARPWLPTVAMLLQLQRPIFLTCYHAGESTGEMELLLGNLGARALTRPADNPFAHLLPVDVISPLADAQAEVERDAVLGEAMAKAEEVAASRAAAVAEAAERSPVALAEELPELCDSINLLRLDNRRCWWAIGEPASATEAMLELAREWLRAFTKLRALRRLPAWLGALQEVAGADEARRLPSSSVLDQRSVDAELVAEATSEVAIALRATELGARPILCAAVAAAEARSTTDAAASENCSAEWQASGTVARVGTLFGEEPAVRFGAACRRALAGLDAAAAAMAPLLREAESPEASSDATLYHVAFSGFVYARSRPSLQAAVAGKLASGASCVTVASCGPWLKLAATHSECPGAWVLRQHPLYGELLLCRGLLSDVM